MFSGEASRVMEFIIVYKLYLRIKMKGATVEKQVQWVLLHVQGKLADIQKENLLEDLELGKFLLELKKEFGGGNEELVKVAELKRIEQGEKIMQKFV